METRDIPVIFISAFDDPADVVEGFDLGGEDYITKACHSGGGKEHACGFI